MSKPFAYGDIVYSDLTLINRHTMSNAAINKNPWISIAPSTQKIPVHLAEFKQICHFLPIVFSPVGKPMPIAISSLKVGENPLVENGEWRQDTYIPAAIRRYPFALADVNNDGKRILYIDSAALSDTHPERLFTESGENTERLTQAIEQCKTYDQHIHKTEGVVDLIESLGLFKDTQLVITMADGSEQSSGTFKIIDIKKYAALNDEQIVLLHKSQALWAIHAHIISMDHMKALSKSIG